MRFYFSTELGVAASYIRQPTAQQAQVQKMIQYSLNQIDLFSLPLSVNRTQAEETNPCKHILFWQVCVLPQVQFPATEIVSQLRSHLIQIEPRPVGI